MDGVHAEIVKALRKVGCQVKDASRVGQGFPDLIVRVPPRFAFVSSTMQPQIEAVGYDPTPPGTSNPLRWRILLMEVKGRKGRLTPDQEEWMQEWPETIIVRSIDEALQAVGVTR